MENNLGKKIIGKPSTLQKVAEAFLFLNWSLRHPNPEWAPFWALFLVGMGSCGRSAEPDFDSLSWFGPPSFVKNVKV